MDMNRRQFFKVCGIGLGGSSLAALGMAPTEAFADQVRHFKLAHTVETRNTCTYCSVGCGLIMYSQGDGAKNVAQNIIHIEGDADHPVNRGTLCPRVCKNTFLSCVLQPIAPMRGDFPIIYHDQRR